ncbi:endonuclease V, partial [Halobacterium salinarum]|nr:endonuclease V [Halobacterium salinarum]
MRVVLPEFRPAPGLDTDAMASRQRDIAAVADF